MKLVLWRVLLDPLTSLRALVIQRRSSTALSYDAAWRRARLDRAPDDMVYRLHGHQATAPPDPPPGGETSFLPPRSDEPTDRCS
ncbi:hypothetical protein [Streptomyces qinzhouensis]|uniref:Uncharacterized protein n=1 Tax=Streptomyces qinzhouensis TaxID=2599401 RepID=A0A5B8JP96_9ACTN|nr:hypothetical protein [Streptomyces qinzhouensis]QDY79493.1 hypothetical protein FQU76_26505 [Streptomyces qinzhouensis]